MESLGVGRTSPPLPFLLRDQTQPGVILSRDKEAGNKVWSPWASGQLPHASPPCCKTRLNQGYSLVRRKKIRTKFGVPGRRDNFLTPPLPSLLRDQTQPGLFSCEKEKAENKVWNPWASGELPHTSPPCCVTRLKKKLFSREKEEAGNKVWSPWASGQLPHPSPPYCVTKLNQGLFSREKEEAGNKVWSPWASGQLPHTSPPCFVSRLNKGYSLVRRKKQGTKFGVPGRRENFPIPHLPAM